VLYQLASLQQQQQVDCLQLSCCSAAVGALPIGWQQQQWQQQQFGCPVPQLEGLQ
jgi:hypothetical protein